MYISEYTYLCFSPTLSLKLNVCMCIGTVMNSLAFYLLHRKISQFKDRQYSEENGLDMIVYRAQPGVYCYFTYGNVE